MGQVKLHKAQLPPKENFDLAMAWGWAGPYLKSGVVVEPKFKGQAVRLGKENLLDDNGNVVGAILSGSPDSAAPQFGSVIAKAAEDLIVEGVISSGGTLVLYDLTYKDGSLMDAPFKHRREILEHIYKRDILNTEDSKHVVLAPQIEIKTFEGLQKAYEVFSGWDGVNGIVLKALTQKYVEGRGENIVKVEKDGTVNVKEDEKKEDEKDVNVDIEARCGGKDKDRRKKTEKAEEENKAVNKNVKILEKVEVKLLKALDLGGEEEHIVYGVALIPNLEDAQGDTMTEEEIRKSAYEYMINAQNAKVQHQGEFVNDVVHLVESYIAPMDMVIARQVVLKGSWVVAFYVEDDEIWKAIKSAELTGFSIGGFGEREAA